MPAGHFYSPFPDLEYIRANELRIYGPPSRTLPSIALNEEKQLSLLGQCLDFYNEQPWSAHKTDGLRYFFLNDFYSYSDALFLYFILRSFKPKRYLEIGSGYSSCLVLDVNDLYFGGGLDVTLIEPYPDNILSLLREDDRSKIDLIREQLQDVDLHRFDMLEAGDVLFVDSTHVSKAGSDIHTIFFEVLPRLKTGVLIHFHDIFYPFEYPKDWVYKGRAWHEDYILRAFLEFNDAFEIILFNTFLSTFHRAYFETQMPLCLENTGGSIWLRRRETNI